MDFSQHKTLQFRRKLLKLIGAQIDITDPSNNQLVGFIKMKAWKLREDIRIYSDQTQSQELVRIHARQIIDFGATYDVLDSKTTEILFAIKRKGLRSTFVRDHWIITDTTETPLGYLQETSSGLALARRYLGIIPFIGGIIDLIFAFIPQTYSLFDTSDNTVATIVHRKNPLIVKMNLRMVAPNDKLDNRAGVAITALLCIIDASKN